MAFIARVIVDIALDRDFDYLIPDDIASIVKIGIRVLVPFGPRKINGYVVGLQSESSWSELKQIISVVDDKPFLSDNLMTLARWMADYYCTSVETAFRALLPGSIRKKGKSFKKRLFVSLCEVDEKGAGAETGGLVLCDEENEGKKVSGKQKAVVDLLRIKGGMFLKDLTAELGVTAAPVKALEKKGVLRIVPETAVRDPLANKDILRTEHLTLMPEQETALNLIKESVDENAERGARNAEGGGESGKSGSGDGGAGRKAIKQGKHVVLLHGVTGSGKTEVYLQAIDYVLGQGRGAIVLVPEIALTPQTVERFVSRFGNRIAVLHSHLSDGERHDEWHRTRDGKADVVVGARSAVFAPIQNLGLIVVDEEHEPSYKQEEAPRYNARDVAAMRGLIENCVVVLGSATPALESWYNAKKGKYLLATLSCRADNRQMPRIRVIDMRIGKGGSGQVGVLSRDLVDAIGARLDRAEQVILFLNRRGFATSLVCQHCGYVANCDQCSVSYTYHRKDEDLQCHICGGTRKVPQKCPSCQDPTFKYAGIGTQRIETIVKKCFPRANVQRIDADMTRKKDSYERILGAFRVGKTDILIGTQMIAKGLHFPNVTLVGVVNADLSLHMPDFRAGERTFQLLCQVAGRAGRGEVSGEVIIQTYTPSHTAIQAARRGDYEGFCDQEVEFRRELSYPPCGRLVCIGFRGKLEDKVSASAVDVARRLRKILPENVIMSEATPAPLARAKGLYRYQLMLRAPSAKTMTDSIRRVLHEVKLGKGVLCSVDVDAISLL